MKKRKAFCTTYNIAFLKILSNIIIYRDSYTCNDEKNRRRNKSIFYFPSVMNRPFN